VVDPAGFQVGLIAIIFDSTNADVFQVTEVQPRITSSITQRDIRHGQQEFQQAYGEGSTVSLINYSGYYGRRNGGPVPPQVDAENVPGDNVLISEIVADDIEDLQIRLVLDDGDGTGRSGIDNTTLARVRQLRIYLARPESASDPQWSEAPELYNHTTLPGCVDILHSPPRRY